MAALSRGEWPYLVTVAPAIGVRRCRWSLRRRIYASIWEGSECASMRESTSKQCKSKMIYLSTVRNGECRLRLYGLMYGLLYPRQSRHHASHAATLRRTWTGRVVPCAVQCKGVRWSAAHAREKGRVAPPLRMVAQALIFFHGSCTTLVYLHHASTLRSACAAREHCASARWRARATGSSGECTTCTYAGFSQSLS